MELRDNMQCEDVGYERQGIGSGDGVSGEAKQRGVPSRSSKGTASSGAVPRHAEFAVRLGCHEKLIAIPRRKRDKSETPFK
jgi:hypothetical protein